MLKYKLCLGGKQSGKASIVRGRGKLGLIHGIGKTGILHVKDETGPLPYTIYKINTKWVKDLNLSAKLENL